MFTSVDFGVVGTKLDLQTRDSQVEGSINAGSVISANLDLQFTLGFPKRERIGGLEGRGAILHDNLDLGAKGRLGVNFGLEVVASSAGENFGDDILSGLTNISEESGHDFRREREQRKPSKKKTSV
jgi:hypothetical protein